jgi:hypothetical protein
MKKRDAIEKATGCSQDQLQRWIGAGLIPSPVQHGRIGARGTQTEWSDDSILRAQIIKYVVRHHSLPDAAFELFLHYFDLPGKVVRH